MQGISISVRHAVTVKLKSKVLQQITLADQATSVRLSILHWDDHLKYNQVAVCTGQLEVGKCLILK